MDWRSHVVQVVAAMPAIGHSKLDKLSAMKCRAAVTMAKAEENVAGQDKALAAGNGGGDWASH